MSALICPHCRTQLETVARQLRCATGHHFDVARGGYVNLATQQSATGDTQAMIEQRQHVFASGVYAPLIETVQRHAAPFIARHDSPLVCDVGAGTGDVLAGLLATHPKAHGFAFDASRAAAKQAQRAHKRIQAVVTDAWQPLPLADQSVTVMISVFAPRNAPEFHRVTATDGAVILVTAGVQHVRELREQYDLIAIDERKEERIQTAFGNGFTHAATQTVSWEFACDSRLAYAMMAMGPNAHHLALTPDEVTFDRTVTAEIVVHVFHPTAG